MNVSRKSFPNGQSLTFFLSQEISESIDLATSSISIKPNNYEGYYARAKALMKANNFTDSLADTEQALEKVKLQQKYQKISSEAKETLSQLCEELSRRVASDGYQTIAEVSLRHHAETTDLWWSFVVQ